MKKIGLITHIADPDGAMPIVLAKLVFSNLEIVSCEVTEVDIYLKEMLSRKEEFEKIYIVDVNITEKMAESILANNESSLIQVFDHHESRLSMNRYPFIKVALMDGTKKACGTSIFYEYLLTISKEPLLRRKSLQTMIHYIRQTDTYDFEEDKEEAFAFHTLYTLYGREKYIDHFLTYVKEKEEFTFDGIEKELIEVEMGRTERYIEEKLSHVKKATIDGIPVGIVFAESYRSELGHKMVSVMPEIDIAIIINVDRAISYRAEKEEIDTNVLSVAYGGGGHPHASGSPLPKALQKQIVEEIFQEVTWEDDYAS